MQCGPLTFEQKDAQRSSAALYMCLAPRARHSTASPPQDGFAVANLGQRPRDSWAHGHER
jgi:hypothetical protein